MGDNTFKVRGVLAEVTRGGTGFRLEGDPEYFNIYSGSVIKNILSNITIGTTIEVEYFIRQGQKRTFKNVIGIMVAEEKR